MSAGSKPSTFSSRAASHRAVRELKRDGLLPADTKVRSSKYLTDVFDKTFWLGVYVIFSLYG